MVGHPAGSGVTAQHEIADIAKATRKLTFSGGFFLVEHKRPCANTQGSSGSRLVAGLQRRTNACLKISLHSVTIVLSILPKRVHH